MTRGHGTVIVSATLLLISSLAVGCLDQRAEEEEEAPVRQRIDESGRVVLTPTERQALDLDVASAEPGTLNVSALRFGRVTARPQEDVLVVAPVTGRLTAPVAALGASLSEGDAVVVIEPLMDTASRASFESERRQLRGQLEGSEAQVVANQADLDRLTTLVSSGLATDADRAQAEATLLSEQARAESLRRAADALRSATGHSLTLQAPTSGVVARLDTDTGSLVQQGAVLARIVQTGPRWIDVVVPPGDPVGSGYRVRGVSGESSARLLNRGSVIQPDGNRSDRLEADPDAATNLPPGLTVPVEILHETQGILVPTAAIVRSGRQNLVFVEAEAGHYAPRVVEIGAEEDGRSVVTSGLSAGDRVVTRGAASLRGELESGSPAGAEERE